MSDTGKRLKTITYYRRFSLDPKRNIEYFLETDYSQIECQGLIDQPHSHETHYGTTIFEGIRAKPNLEKLGAGILELSVINLERNTLRFFRSMEHMGFIKTPEIDYKDVPEGLDLKPYDSSKDMLVPDDFEHNTFQKLIFELIRRNTAQGYVKPEDGKLYIRPVMHRGSHPEGKLGVQSSQHDIVFRLIVQEWGNYLPDGINLVVYPYSVEEPMRRIKTGANYALGSTAKNFAASFKTAGGRVSFDDVLFTDNERNIEEATGANFFAFSSEKTIMTPPTSQYILPGITRGTAIELAQNLGFNVIECDINISELKDMRAAFLTGTATGLRSVNLVYDTETRAVYQFDKDYAPFKMLQEKFNNLINGREVSEKNKELQALVRKVIVPMDNYKVGKK